MNGEYYYEYEQDNFYCYPGTYVLKNKLNILDENELKTAEREITSLRTAQALTSRIEGNFDFKHLAKIHNFLFGDIYEWAGNIRTVNISKGNKFCLCQFIQSQMDEIFQKLKNENYLKDYTDKNEVAKRLAYYLGEINSIHPFREGNGRTQRMFIEHLAASLSYRLDYMKITSSEMLEASAQAFMLDYTLMEELIIKAMSIDNYEL
ncbi:Fic/DOC family protein [Anaerocolumna jejuensis]|uniref:Fic/DOC family protein n=1 Tax=Anaerocolumna jejuensis TaxID=259063 RepID=UPI003F7B9B94